MEVPVINRISDFEGGGINPSVVARAFAASGIERIYQAYSVWKWGALMVALLVASITTIVSRIRILLIRFRQSRPISTAAALLIQEESDYDTESESGSESEFSDEEEEETDEDFEEEEVHSDGDEDFSVRGSSKFARRLRRRSSSIGDFFSWPEFANGTTSSVVKLWDNLGLGLDGEPNLRSIFGAGSEMLFPGAAVSASAMSPAVIVSAETNMAGNLLRVWDSRVGCRIPQILAEWRPMLGNIVGVNAAGFLEKVYVNELTVADMRKKAPVVGSVTESEAAADPWCDADAVIVGNDSSSSSSSKFDSLRRRG
ncbi:unnamed protein product [Linum tenue]|uniref:Uncharacterized protein n=1 Tax=Linum tenue TaxID=586396 RepID=A0AAV0NJ88_9ROSI|nr:unnamed protein product [Linum tenue]